MKYDIAVVGSINMDVVVSTPKYPDYGQTLFCEKIDMIPGGKGANQAVTVAQMEKKVCMLGAVGDDAPGNELIRNLNSRGIDTSHLVSVSNNGTGTFVAMVDPSGENTMVGTKGANESLSKENIEDAFSKIEADILLVQMETSRESILTSMKIAKERGMYVILDPAPADGIFEEAFQYADLILPNNQETEAITGIKVVDPDTATQAAAKLHAFGIRDVMVKMGENGVLVSTKGQETFIDAIKVKAVDTVGAGDCYAGAVASKLSETRDLVEAAKFATVAAGIKVSRTGGHDAVPSLEEVVGYSK
jgi:ribokinase